MKRSAPLSFQTTWESLQGGLVPGFLRKSSRFSSAKMLLSCTCSEQKNNPIQKLFAQEIQSMRPFFLVGFCLILSSWSKCVMRLTSLAVDVVSGKANNYATTASIEFCHILLSGSLKPSPKTSRLQKNRYIIFHNFPKTPSS